MASGLVGPLVVCRKGTLNEKRRRKDINREFALLFMVFDENESWYMDENRKNLKNKNPFREEGFLESNMMHGENKVL